MKFIVILWIAAASLLALILYGADKYKAKKRLWRIPESVLLGVALLGGALGAMLGMRLFRHKTKHVKFLIGVPLCLLVNAVAVYFLFTKVL